MRGGQGSRDGVLGAGLSGGLGQQLGASCALRAQALYWRCSMHRARTLPFHTWPHVGRRDGCGRPRRPPHAPHRMPLPKVCLFR